MKEANLIDIKINFASAESARDYLKMEDKFLLNLSPFDRSARLNTSREVNNLEFVDFISKQTLNWDTNEKENIINIMNEIMVALSEYNIFLPNEIIFITTTGLEEGGAAYCRANNIIVLPFFSHDTILHELFHIYSRNNLKIQEVLYGILGFKKCNELLLPAEIFQYKITNPDTAHNNYCFPSMINGRNFNLMPILLSPSNYDEHKGGKFFSYVELHFIAVIDNGQNMVPIIENNNFLIYTLEQIPNDYGYDVMNTYYNIHPEEILADNFVYLITKEENLPNMELIERMKEILKKS